jgi:hypothetical protein
MAGQIAPLHDRSFEDYSRAVAGIASTPPPDVRIGYGLGYLDAHFVYPVFAIDSWVAGDLGDSVKLAIRYIQVRQIEPVFGAFRSQSNRLLFVRYRAAEIAQLAPGHGAPASHLGGKAISGYRSLRWQDGYPRPRRFISAGGVPLRVRFATRRYKKKPHVR